jgi:hypothetical protein
MARKRYKSEEIPRDLALCRAMLPDLKSEQGEAPEGP